MARTKPDAFNSRLAFHDDHRVTKTDIVRRITFGPEGPVMEAKLVQYPGLS